MIKLTKETVLFALKCIKKQMYEDELENTFGDHPREPSWEIESKEYSKSIEKLEKYLLEL